MTDYEYQEEFDWLLDEFTDWCELCKHMPEFDYDWFGSNVGWC